MISFFRTDNLGSRNAPLSLGVITLLVALLVGALVQMLQPASAAHLSAPEKEAALDQVSALRRANLLDSALVVAESFIREAQAEPDSGFLLNLLILKGQVVVPAYMTELMGAVSLAGAILLQRRPGPGGNRTALA